MSWGTRLLVWVMATWRLSAYLAYENGGQWIRDWAKIYAVDDSGTPVTRWGRVLSCFWCTSSYVAWILAPVVWSPIWWVLAPIAVSGVAILLNHVSRIFRWAED